MYRIPKAVARLLTIIVIGAAMPGCASSAAAQQHESTADVRVYTTATSTSTPAPTSTPTRVILPTRTPNPGIWASATALAAMAIQQEATATTAPTLSPENWQNWPIVPEISAKAIEIYLKGQQLGNDPHSFIRIGDCQSEPEVFLGIYDDPTRYYFEPKYAYLQQTVNQFAGSFARSNVTARRGFGVACGQGGRRRWPWPHG